MQTSKTSKDESSKSEASPIKIDVSAKIDEIKNQLSENVKEEAIDEENKEIPNEEIDKRY